MHKLLTLTGVICLAAALGLYVLRPDAQVSVPVQSGDPTMVQQQLHEAVPAPKFSRTAARAVKPGEALVTMRIPRFGEEWEWVALEGTADEIIANGPGHYSWTPLPGDKGNVGFAAHRAGHGDPFIDFDLLRPGDEVTFSQGQRSWTYRITMRPVIINPDDVWVLDPLKGHWLTLTTCWPKYGSSHRMYVRAKLID
jgi:sortase A